jgi:hypothetical protein
MNPEEFLKTIYLGDRGCKKILIDGWNHRFCIQVNSISRLETGTDTWNYYTDKDVENGWLVFSELSAFAVNPDGLIPNDFINSIAVSPQEYNYLFSISVGSCSDVGDIREVTINLTAKSVHIESNEVFLKALSAG